MRRTTTILLGPAIALAATSVVVGLALAQVSPPAVAPGDPKGTIPEKVLPPSQGIPAPNTPPPKPDAPPTGVSPGTSTGVPPDAGNRESLTEKLDRTDGVLVPQPGVSPPMTVPAPAPGIDREMVVPPPMQQQAPVPPK